MSTFNTFAAGIVNKFNTKVNEAGNVDDKLAICDTYVGALNITSEALAAVAADTSAERDKLGKAIALIEATASQIEAAAAFEE